MAYGAYSNATWANSLSSRFADLRESVGFGNGKQDYSYLVTDEARQGPFQIGVQVAGHVDSSGNATLTCLVEGSTTIISIVPEGTMVKAGQVICELDASALREKSTLQEIKVSQADAAFITAEKNLEILLRQNETDIEAVKLKIQLADLDLDKFENGEYPKSVNMLEGNKAIAEEELVRISENYEFTKLQVKKGARTQNDMEADRISVKQSKLKLATAIEELKVLKQYDYNRRIAELKANSQEFKRELERTQIKCDAAVVQAQKDLEAKKLTSEAERLLLERLQKQIAGCTMKAPQDGEVVYANLQNNSGRGGGQNPETIAEGAAVRERQAIINLPDITKMKVDCRIHESQIAAVRKGLPVRIRIEAFPEMSFNGMVTEVSSVPITGRWPNMDLREYDTEITLTDDIDVLKKLRPGLTAQVEILVDNRDNVLQIPVQSVVAVPGKQFTFVLGEAGPQRRDLVVGQSNQTHVEVKDGLKPGDRVVMNPRSQFAEQIAAVENELAKEMAKKAADKKIPPAGPGDRIGPPAGPGAPAGPGQGPPAGPQKSPEERFAGFDKNSDGKLTADEAPPFLKDRMTQLDKDGDGNVTLEEFRAGAPQLSRRPPGGEGGPTGG
jgi:HlyD family secretion protein